MTASAFGNPYLFTGRRLDILDSSSLKLQYSRARYYDPQTGRFTQRDPLGINPAGSKQNPFQVWIQYFDGTNIYEYVKSNSVNLTDAYGLAANAQAQCNPSTGNVDITIFNKGCSKVCSEAHEKVHRKQHGSCCKRLSKCLKKGYGTKYMCIKAYNDWMAANKNRDECQAHSKSVSCARAQMASRKCKKKCTPTLCCLDLDSYLRNQKANKNAYCGAGGSKQSCPFTWSGKIK